MQTRQLRDYGAGDHLRIETRVGLPDFPCIVPLRDDSDQRPIIEVGSGDLRVIGDGGNIKFEVNAKSGVGVHRLDPFYVERVSIDHPRKHILPLAGTVLNRIEIVQAPEGVYTTRFSPKGMNVGKSTTVLRAEPDSQLPGIHAYEFVQTTANTRNARGEVGRDDGAAGLIDVRPARMYMSGDPERGIVVTSKFDGDAPRRVCAWAPGILLRNFDSQHPFDVDMFDYPNDISAQELQEEHVKRMRGIATGWLPYRQIMTQFLADKVLLQVIGNERQQL